MTSPIKGHFWGGGPWSSPSLLPCSIRRDVGWASVGRAAKGLLFIHHLPLEVGTLRHIFLSGELIERPKNPYNQPYTA